MSSYYYHSTLLLFLPSIAAGGLKPQSECDGEQFTFVEPDYDGAALYLNGNCRMLRFPSCGHTDTEDGECVVTQIVSAEAIEVEVRPGAWVALRGAIADFPAPDLANYTPGYFDAQAAVIAEHLNRK